MAFSDPSVPSCEMRFRKAITLYIKHQCERVYNEISGQEQTRACFSTKQVHTEGAEDAVAATYNRLARRARCLSLLTDRTRSMAWKWNYIDALTCAVPLASLKQSAVEGADGKAT